MQKHLQAESTIISLLNCILKLISSGKMID